MSSVWVNKTVVNPLGTVIVSVRLDTIIDPNLMLEKLDKEHDSLIKQLDKILKKLDKLNDKTPENVLISTLDELDKNNKLLQNNSSEWHKWFSVWLEK